MLAIPNRMLAQLGGGGGGGGGMGGGGGSMSGGTVGSRPDGVAEKDGLQAFHRAMAVQATPEQRDAFVKVAQSTQVAIDKVADFRQSLSQTLPQPLPVPLPQISASAVLDRASTIDQALQKARAGSQSFVASLSSAQKSGLQDLTKKLGKADLDLDRQIKGLDLVVHTPKPENEQIASSAAALEKAIASFQSEQLALGRDMGVLFPEPGQDVTFKLAPMTNSIRIAGQSVSIRVSGTVVSRVDAETAGRETPVASTSAESGNKHFSLKLVADLSDLQQNISAILRAQLNRSPRCGERIEIQQATLTPLTAASLVVAHLHFERWVCQPGSNQAGSIPGGAGWQGSTEVADGNATIEVKLTASVEPNAAPGDTGLALASEITRVEAEGLLRNLLRSGDLGATLRQQIAASILSAMQQATDFKSTLPPAAQQSATIQKAYFQDDGVEQMSLVLDGQLQLSDEQTQQFAAQLKQRLAAQGTPKP